jgi:hypothetical protein
MSVSTVYKALSSKKFLNRLDEIEKIIKFSSLPKNGIDQCDGQDDPTGVLNFKKAFGEEMSEGIDFNTNNFIFSKMRKVCLSNSRLQIIATPRAPDVFQDNLTKYLATLEKNTIIVSDYMISDSSNIQDYGAKISYICGSQDLHSFRFEINFFGGSKPRSWSFFEKNGLTEEKILETQTFDDIDDDLRKVLINDCILKIVKMVLAQSKVISKMKDIELILRASFFHFGIRY